MNDMLIEKYGDMFKFNTMGDFRPRIKDTHNEEFQVYDLKNGSIVIDRNDIDDLIGLLTAVKLNDYKID